MKSIAEYESKIKRILITKEEIADAIAEAGKKIDQIYDGRPILLVSILKGAFVFMADLCRAVSVPCEIGFMCAKSYYEGTESSGVVKITMDLDRDISGYHVIIVEDIVDTGYTMQSMLETLGTREPASLEIASLFVKPARLKVPVDVKYSVFTIPDRFIVGFGLDYDRLGRNLPDIYDAAEE